MPHFNSKGFSSVELVLGSVIGVVGLVGAMSVYSFVGSRNQAMELNRATAALTEILKRNLTVDQKANWLALSASACTSSSSTPLRFPSFTNSEYRVALLDSAKLGVLLPANNPDGSANEARKAINHLISQYGAQASSKCADATALADAKYEALRNSEVNQLLCRCASAVTSYATLQTKLSDFKTRSALYACVEISLNSNASSVSQVSTLLRKKTAIGEISYSLFNVNDNSLNTCQQLAGAVPAKALSRLDYTFASLNQQKTSGRSQRKTGSYLMD